MSKLHPKLEEKTLNFLHRAKEKYADLYDYSEVNPRHINRDIVVICRTHGTFTTTIADHIKGKGCSICKDVNKGSNNRINFIVNANEVHGNRYSYALVTNFIGSATNRVKLPIMCSKHGVFEQTVGSHIHMRSGCPYCAKGRYQDVPTILYYIKLERDGIIGYKIGITSKDTMRRYRQELLEGLHITILDELLFNTGKEAYKVEQSILSTYRHNKHTDGAKLLPIGGSSEVFFNDILSSSLSLFKV